MRRTRDRHGSTVTGRPHRGRCAPTPSATATGCSRSPCGRSRTTGRTSPLDAIAKEAGVGIGTLYRHFPTREALVEAAYRNELARLCDAAGELLDTQRAGRTRCAPGWTASSTT